MSNENGLTNSFAGRHPAKGARVPAVPVTNRNVVDVKAVVNDGGDLDILGQDPWWWEIATTAIP